MKTSIVLSVLAFTVAVDAQPDSAPYIEPTEGLPAPSMKTKSVNVPRFQLRDRGRTTARIIDSESKTVLTPFPKTTIIKYSVSPDGKRILVYYGNSDYAVYDPETEQRIILPQQPPGEKKIAFSTWHWIGDKAILGEAGDELASRNDVPGEDTMDIRGRLYLYRVDGRQLTEVRLPKSVAATRFAVFEVNSEAYVHLMQSTPTAKEVKDLGWFKLSTK